MRAHRNGALHGLTGMGRGRGRTVAAHRMGTWAKGAGAPQGRTESVYHDGGAGGGTSPYFKGGGEACAGRRGGGGGAFGGGGGHFGGTARRQVRCWVIGVGNGGGRLVATTAATTSTASSPHCCRRRDCASRRLRLPSKLHCAVVMPAAASLAGSTAGGVWLVHAVVAVVVTDGVDGGDGCIGDGCNAGSRGRWLSDGRWWLLDGDWRLMGRRELRSLPQGEKVRRRLLLPGMRPGPAVSLGDSQQR